MIVRLPEFVVTRDELVKNTPVARFDPLAAMPVIVTLPAPVAETLADVER